MILPAIQDDTTQQTAADRRLLAGVARGETSAFAALYDRLAGPLYALCLRMTGEAHEAEDILQEVSLLIWRRAASYDAGKSTVFGWAVHLTRCKAIDYLRSRGRRLRVMAPERPLMNPEDGQPITNGLLEAATASEISAGDQADLKDRARRVRHVLKELPAEQLQAIEMAFFSDLSHHEISARLGQPLGTIKARIRRGLLKLRDTLGQLP